MRRPTARTARAAMDSWRWRTAVRDGIIIAGLVALNTLATWLAVNVWI